MIKTAIKFEWLRCVIRNMFSPFGYDLIDSRMKILIHVEKIRSGGRIRIYGPPKADQQPWSSVKVDSAGRIRPYVFPYLLGRKLPLPGNQASCLTHRMTFSLPFAGNSAVTHAVIELTAGRFY